MKITILGCGISGGVPLIGNNWGTCDPKEPKNRRRRASILVEQGTTTILVDTSPDMREQLLDCNLQDLSAVFYTHAHADHVHGIDDLRSVNWLTQKPIPVYGDAATLDHLKKNFSYIFTKPDEDRSDFYKPVLETHLINGPFEFEGLKVTPFEQGHGQGTTLGYRFGNFAYSPDVNHLDEAAFEILKGVKIWVVDAAREKPHPTHAHLAQTLEWIARVKPEKAYLTHMNETMDYAGLCARLPANIEPAYDGLVIEL